MPKVIIEAKNTKDEPKPYEISAAVIMANYFNTDVTIMKRHPHAHKADFLIKNQMWELKSPTGDGKRTIQNNLRDASDQSNLIILDLRRCKLHPTRALSRVRYELSKATGIKRLLVIAKSGKVLDIK